MSFPRPPRKKIKGTLKIQVRAPLSISTEEEEEEQPVGVDHSVGMKFNLPLGFNSEDKTSEIVENQRKFILGQIKDLYVKLDNCSDCVSKHISRDVLSSSTQLLEFGCDWLSKTTGRRVAVLFGHRPDSSTTLNFECGERSAIFLIVPGSFEIAVYKKQSVYKELSANLISGQIDDVFSWICGSKEEL